MINLPRIEWNTENPVARSRLTKSEGIHGGDEKRERGRERKREKERKENERRIF